jgi:hypothetical protein
MKKLIFLIFVLAISSLVSAQTVLVVPATDESGNPIINALTKYVVADTNANGEQLHDIYKLERGKTYFYNESPVFQNPITLIADEPGTTDETKPPKILITADDAGEIPYEHCITTFADLTIKNIAFTTTSIDESYSWANAILLQSDGLRIKLEGCHFELIGWGMLEAAVENTVFILDKCHIRNGTVIPDGDEWCPFFMEVDVGSLDSVIVRNCTFFNLQGSVINIEQQNLVKYLLFDHNTMVNIVKGFSTEINAHLNSTFTNNIFYNVTVHGSLIADVEGGGGDHVPAAVITVDTLISNEPGADPSTFVMAEADRIMTVKNNVYFTSPEVTAYWTEFADSLLPNPWMDARTQAMFDNNTDWPNFVEENNVNVDPGFVNFGGTKGMVAQMRNHRNGEAFGFWGWDPDSAMYPDVHWAFLQWPLPEDFSYSANLTSTDGFHVGSLEYYPNELAQYEALTAVKDGKIDNVPQKFSLEQNYPNPFNPVTTINYTLNASGDVKLIVYNMLGQKIKTLVNNSQMAAGNHQITWEGTNDLGQQVSNGIYFYKLQTGSNAQIRKMMFLK